MCSIMMGLVSWLTLYTNTLVHYTNINIIVEYKRLNKIITNQ